MTRYLLFATLALLLSAPGSADDSAQSSLAEARARWANAGIVSYRYVYQKHCACYSGEPPEIVVTVTNGRVTEAFSRDAFSEREVPAGDDRLDLYYTIEDLFAKLAAAHARQVTVAAEYDATLGFPRRIFIDEFADFTGEETDLTLSALERR